MSGQLSTIANYWKKLQSFQDAMGKSKSFHIVVTTTDGQVFRSSPLPNNEMMDQVQAAIECSEENGGFSLWTGTMSQLVFIPHKSITTIVIVLAPSS